MKKSSLITILSCLTLGSTAIQADEQRLLAGKAAFADEAKNQPAKILFDEALFDATGDVFFIARDYRQSYSKLVRYNLARQEVSTVFKSENGSIHDAANQGGLIAFSVLAKDGAEYHQSVYCYEVGKGELKKVADNLNRTRGIYPVRVGVGGGKIAWLEHLLAGKDSVAKGSGKKNSSTVQLYDVKTRTLAAAGRATLGDSDHQVPIFFNDLSDTTLVYDRVTESGGLELVLFDAAAMMERQRLPAMDGIKLHFNGAFNAEHGYLALYAKAADGDVIYVVNVRSGKTQKLVGFHKSTYLYNDQLATHKSEILYTVQLDTSGRIQDHYYTEVYDLATFKMDKQAGHFDIVKTEKYTGALRFDDTVATNTIHFELWRN